ncbi:hypothetical protein HPB51_008038 [Rhipicephalus microplus]|uniref:Ionotropic glutamate receptor C-terminal domain-containing protein n=1 Tax=Rhipicephalus microplus TaxID=6941 RepID=A0A9J6ERI7_RHIMP|nr:hypothetical protein HPB51_008038 [Rhipicephalus microplus]
MLLEHMCQVISVTVVDINAPLDGYRSCEERRVILAADVGMLAGYRPHAGRFPKDTRVVFANQDDSSRLCYTRESFITLVRLAYAALNITLVETCNSGETDSLLLDRRVDFVTTIPKVVSLRSYYGYVMFPPSSLCFLSRRATPLPPSFVSSWLSFLQIYLIVCTLALVLLVLMSVEARLRSIPATKRYNLFMFFTSTYLGRSPASIPHTMSTPVKICIIAWMFMMLILGQFTQTAITASRSVPALSSQMKSVAPFVSRLDDGSVLPCMHFFAKNIVDEFSRSVSHLNVLREALEDCGPKCLTHNVRDFSFPLAQSGTHAIVHMCRLFKGGKGCSRGLAVGEELVTYLKWLPTHTRFLLRHQHRRLLLAMEEAGLWLRQFTRRFTPCTNGIAMAVFDIAFSDYATVYLVGCALSLLAFSAEVAYQRCFLARRL